MMEDQPGEIGRDQKGRPNGPKYKGEPPTEFNRRNNREAGLRKKRFDPAASPSTAVAESYRIGALTGTPKQRLGLFGQAGRLETLRKGLARMSPAMSNRLRKRSVEHLKALRTAQEFARGAENPS
jgi:hypothetical protein